MPNLSVAKFIKKYKIAFAQNVEKPCCLLSANTISIHMIFFLLEVGGNGSKGMDCEQSRTHIFGKFFC